MSVITERDAAKGKYRVFKDPKMEVKIRAIMSTEDWLDECAEVDVALVALEADPSNRELRRKYSAALYDCFFNYDPEVNREAIEDKVTPAQIAEAFRVMREEFDPFAQAQKKKSEEHAKLQTESLEAFKHLPANVVAMLPDIIEAEGGLKL